MNQKNMLLLAGLIVFTFISSPAFAVDDEWTDYDPCGWSAEQEVDNTVAELEWTDYDPCGLNVEDESGGTEVVAELEWTDYDPCGWNVENETVNAVVAKTFMSGDTDYMN